MGAGSEEGGLLKITVSSFCDVTCRGNLIPFKDKERKKERKL